MYYTCTISDNRRDTLSISELKYNNHWYSLNWYHIRKKWQDENTSLCTIAFLIKYNRNIHVNYNPHVCNLVGIHNYLSLPPILHFLRLQQVPQQVLALFLEEWPIPSFLMDLCCKILVKDMLHLFMQWNICLMVQRYAAFFLGCICSTL